MLNDVRDPPRLAAVAGERRMANARLCAMWHGVVSVSDAAPGGTARECGFCSKKPAQELSIGIFPACVSRSSSRLVAESWRNHGCGSGGIRDSTQIHCCEGAWAGQRHDHLHASPRAAGFDLESPAQFTDPFAHSGQAYARGAGRPETVDHFLRNADAMISDGQRYLLALSLEANFGCAALGMAMDVGKTLLQDPK